MTASVASICSGVALPVRDHQHRVLLEPPAELPVLEQELHHLRVQDVGGELPVRAADRERPVEVLGLQVDVGLPLSRPTNRSRKFSGSTLSGGMTTPIDSASTEKRCTVVVVWLPPLVLVVLYS